MRLSQLCSCLHKSDELFDYDKIVMWDPSSIWELTYGPQMFGAHKWGMNFIVWLRYYVFMLSTRFIRTSANSLSHKTWNHFLFAQHLETYLLWHSGHNGHAYDTIFIYLFLCWKLKNQYLIFMVITFCKKRPRKISITAINSEA